MAYQTPSFADLYKPYHQTYSTPFANPNVVSPTTPPTAPPPAPTPSPDPFQALITSLLTPRPPAQGNQIPWHELISAIIPGDTQGDANRLAALPSNVPGSQSPFNTGFFDVTKPSNSSFGLTPEARLASQGSSAQTQWGARGGVRGVDPDILRNLLNQRQRASQTPASGY